MTTDERWTALRLAEFSNEIDTLIASGEDEVTAGALAYGSLINDIASYCGMDSMVVFALLQAECAKRSAANPDPIITWLRSQMDEPSI